MTVACRLNIVIPVYNGEKVVGDTLARLAVQCGALVNLTVVVNGSVDRSMDVARAALAKVAQTGARTQLVCLRIASRTEALNAGDVFADPGGHHLYMDQDVRLSPGGLARIVETLDQGVQFVGARARWRTSSHIVQAAMAAWNSLPYVKGAPVTAGAYAVSAEGRRRWGAWPSGLPDDKFARLNFRPEERLRLDDVEYSALAPVDFAGLVKARARYARYNQSLQRLTPRLASQDIGRGPRNLIGFPPNLFPGLTVLVAAEALAQLRVRQ